VVKNKENGGELVFRHLYTYLVLFTTLMMVICGSISVFMAAADLISPPAYYQSFDEYSQMKDNKQNGEQKEQELREDYEQSVKEEENRRKANAINQIIKSLGFIVIPLPIFLYFNRLRRRQSIGE
jgi:sortase (surface protein transpeptidase)